MAEVKWRPAFKADPSDTQRRLLPVWVEDCEPKGLLADLGRLVALMRGKGPGRRQPKTPLGPGGAPPPGPMAAFRRRRGRSCARQVARSRSKNER